MNHIFVGVSISSFLFGLPLSGMFLLNSDVLTQPTIIEDETMLFKHIKLPKDYIEQTEINYEGEMDNVMMWISMSARHDNYIYMYKFRNASYSDVKIDLTVNGQKIIQDKHLKDVSLDSKLIKSVSYSQEPFCKLEKSKNLLFCTNTQEYLNLINSIDVPSDYKTKGFGFNMEYGGSIYFKNGTVLTVWSDLYSVEYYLDSLYLFSYRAEVAQNHAIEYEQKLNKNFVWKY